MPQEDVPIAFFSYCREDSEFALKLAADLKVAGAHVWIDQLDIEPGTPWDRAVEEALTHSPRMLVVLSPVSVNSDNVRDEVSFALSRQKRVIPVLYRDCDVPFRLARLQHIDFRPDYSRALTILLRALGVGQPAPSHPPMGAALAAAAESVASRVEAEAEEQARRQKLEDERRLADEQAQLEEARKYAAEKARLKKEREAAAEQAAREQQEPQRSEADERARQEQLRREQRAAEQARLEEEARLAAERVRLAQQEQERREAEIKARQEQLRREEQESVERKSVVLGSEPEPMREAAKPQSQPDKSAPSDAPAAQPTRPEVTPKPVAARARIEPSPAPVTKVTPPPQPPATGLNLTSPKYLAGGAILVIVLGVIVFLLTHRAGPEKAPESAATQSTASEPATVQQPQTQTPTQQAAPPPSETQSAAPVSAAKQDQAKENPKPSGTDKDLAKAKELAPPPADMSPKNPTVGSVPLNPANAANTSTPAKHITRETSHGMLMREVAPAYPPLARSARVQGPVVLDVVIGKDGSVTDIKAESGHPLLVPAAIDAVKKWRYKPYKLAGKPVEVTTQVVVDFTLTN